MFEKLKEYISLKPILSIIIFGIVIRLLLLPFYRDVTIFPDSEGYIDLAKFLLNYNLTGYDGMRSPGYPLLLLLAGNMLPLVIFFQSVIGIITSVYLYKIILLLNFSDGTAVIYTIILNSFIHVLFYETAILTESFTLFFIIIIFYHLFKGFFSEKSGLKKAFVLSLLLGFLTLIKPFYIFLPFLIYLLYIIKDFRLSSIINCRMVIIIFPLLSFLGWSYVNKINTGYFVSTTIDGIYTAQNCVYFAENTSPKYIQVGTIYAKHREERIKNDKDVAMTIWAASNELMDKTGLPFNEFSHMLNGYNKVTIKMNFGAYIKQVITRSWVDFWKTAMYWNYDDFKIPYINKFFLLIWYIQSFILQVLKIIFIFLIPYHFIRFLKIRLLTPEFIIVTIVFCTSVLQAIVTYGTNSRFSYPFEFLMLITLLLTFRKYLHRKKLI